MVSVGLLLPPRFAVLSFAPLAAFETANMVLGERFYDIHAVSASGGQVINSFGKHVETERGDDVRLDTLLVGAPPDVEKPPADVLEFVRRAKSIPDASHQSVWEPSSWVKRDFWTVGA